MLSLHRISTTAHHCSKRGSGKLEKVNERALRFVTRDKSTTYETLLKQLNLLSPFNQELLKWPPVFTKLSMGINVPREIGGLLYKLSTNYNLRGKHILELPKVNTTTYGPIWKTLLDQFRAANKYNTITFI